MPTYTLKKPIVMPDGKQFAVLDVDEMHLGAIAAHEMALAETGSDNMALIAAVVQQTGWPREAVVKIRQSDLEGVAALFRPLESAEGSGGIGDPSPPTSPGT